MFYARYAVVSALSVLNLIMVHSLLQTFHQDYRRLIRSYHPFSSHIRQDRHAHRPKDWATTTPSHKANATLLMLARNSDLLGAIESIRSMNEQFNDKFKYPWVFLNDMPFSEEFKRTVTAAVNGVTVEFGLISADSWKQPQWIDEEAALRNRKDMVHQHVLYGGSVSYRNMCRFFSGFFYHHELVLKYEWYWRVEPNVYYHCRIDEDPFLFMENHNKTYGFTMTVKEIPETIPMLWTRVKEFTAMYPDFVAENNAMDFISFDGGKTYNFCHFWSNFEIANLNFYRSPAYTSFFSYLDSRGGFYYERWGDAPVHSIAASLFLDRNQLHFFDSIGYRHESWSHCPNNKQTWEQQDCDCDRQKSFDFHGGSCKQYWDRLHVNGV